MTQTVKEKRTLVRFAVQKTRYVAGNGAATEWETIKVNIGTTDDGKPITTDCFYVEWLSSYGAAAIQQQSDGVIRPARVALSTTRTLSNSRRRRTITFSKTKCSNFKSKNTRLDNGR